MSGVVSNDIDPNNGAKSIVTWIASAYIFPTQSKGNIISAQGLADVRARVRCSGYELRSIAQFSEREAFFEAVLGSPVWELMSSGSYYSLFSGLDLLLSVLAEVIKQS